MTGCCPNRRYFPRPGFNPYTFETVGPPRPDHPKWRYVSTTPRLGNSPMSDLILCYGTNNPYACLPQGRSRSLTHWSLYTAHLSLFTIFSSLLTALHAIGHVEPQEYKNEKVHDDVNVHREGFFHPRGSCFQHDGRQDGYGQHRIANGPGEIAEQRKIDYERGGRKKKYAVMRLKLFREQQGPNQDKDYAEKVVVKSLWRRRSNVKNEINCRADYEKHLQRENEQFNVVKALGRKSE